MLNFQSTESLSYDFEILEEPFRASNSEYMQKKYFAVQGSLILPLQHVLGSCSNTRNDREMGANN